MKLDKNNIEYEYNDFDNLSIDDREYFINLAEEEGKATFPIMIEGEKLCTMDDIERMIK